MSKIRGRDLDLVNVSKIITASDDLSPRKGASANRNVCRAKVVIRDELSGDRGIMTRSLLKERNIHQRSHEAGAEEEFLRRLGNNHPPVTLIKDDLWSVIIREFDIKTIEEGRLAIHSGDVSHFLLGTATLRLNFQIKNITILDRSTKGDLEGLKGSHGDAIGDGICPSLLGGLGHNGGRAGDGHTGSI